MRSRLTCRWKVRFPSTSPSAWTRSGRVTPAGGRCARCWQLHRLVAPVHLHPSASTTLNVSLSADGSIFCPWLRVSGPGGKLVFTERRVKMGPTECQPGSEVSGKPLHIRGHVFDVHDQSLVSLSSSRKLCGECTVFRSTLVWTGCLLHPAPHTHSSPKFKPTSGTVWSTQCCWTFVLRSQWVHTSVQSLFL